MTQIHDGGCFVTTNDRLYLWARDNIATLAICLCLYKLQSQWKEDTQEGSIYICRERKFTTCSMRQDSELMVDWFDKKKTITSKSVSSGGTSSLLSLIPDKTIIDNTLARQSLWKNEMKTNTLQRLMVFWVSRFSLHNSVRTWSPMNHLAEPGLKGARAEARASWFYFTKNWWGCPSC